VLSAFLCSRRVIRAQWLLVGGPGVGGCVERDRITTLHLVWNDGAEHQWILVLDGCMSILIGVLFVILWHGTDSVVGELAFIGQS
jgi:hypothetical protein